MSAPQRVKPPTKNSRASSQGMDECALFKEEFPKRFSVRIHMTVLLFGVFFSGLLINKLLFEFGMRSMPERYVIAVCRLLCRFLSLDEDLVVVCDRVAKKEATVRSGYRNRCRRYHRRRYSRRSARSA